MSLRTVLKEREAVACVHAHSVVQVILQEATPCTSASGLLGGLPQLSEKQRDAAWEVG